MKSSRWSKPYGLLAAALAVAGLSAAWMFRGAPAPQPAAPAPPAAARQNTAAAAAGPLTQAQLLDGFRHLEVASISDAIEKVLGRKMYMGHDMRPLFASKFVGYALTVQMKAQENTQGAAGLSGMIKAIDQGGPDSVYVMVVPNGLNYAGIGGEMSTAMHARNFAGAVVDGGVRDVAYIQQMQFPVFGRGIVPSTTVDHYLFQAANVPVLCDGVKVSPRDIVAADMDGVVVVPRASEAAVLKVAQDMDFTEHTMDPAIAKYKSLEKAVKQYGRI